MALIASADPDHVALPVDLTTVDVRSIHPSLTREDCMRSMHVVSSKGRVSSGFDGMRALAAWLPLFWPLAIIGYLPGVAWIGRRVYNRFAATRPRDVPCTDEVCGIHSRTPPTAHGDRGLTQHHHDAVATLPDTEEAPHP